MVWPIVAAGAVGAVGSLMSAQQGASATKAAARRTAEMIRLEGEIALKRAERDLQQTVGTAVARSYASGIEMSGSNQIYIDALQSRGEEYMTDMRRLIDAKAKAAKAGGNAAASGLLMQGGVQAIGGLAQAGADAYAYHQTRYGAPTATGTG